MPVRGSSRWTSEIKLQRLVTGRVALCETPAETRQGCGVWNESSRVRDRSITSGGIGYPTSNVARIFCMNHIRHSDQAELA